jgi:hypothetical protein
VLGLLLDLLGHGINQCISLALQITIQAANLRRRLQLARK